MSSPFPGRYQRIPDPVWPEREKHGLTPEQIAFMEECIQQVKEGKYRTADEIIAELEGQTPHPDNDPELVRKIKEAQCEWIYDDTHDKWDTACGEMFVMIEGTPHDNGMVYCPYCGKAINFKEEARDE